MRVRAYLRVSTDEQAEEGFSIPHQRQRVLDYCCSQWGRSVAVEWYIDDGYSAKSLDRPALARLRRELQADDSVVVLRLDRLTRSVHDLYTLLKEWDDRGAFFRSVTEPYNTRTSEGRFMIGLLALLAQWERERISERVREVMANITRTEGRHLNRPPLGYRHQGGRLVSAPDEAALVCEIFQRYAGGEGYRSIALSLNRRCRTRDGSRWRDSSVAYILRNPVYAGKLTFGRLTGHGGRRRGAVLVADADLLAGQHEPLVDPQLWQAVQAEIRRRQSLAPRAATSAYPLSGVARCAGCGAPLSGYSKRRRRADGSLYTTRYYLCTGRSKQGSCRLPYLAADRAEAVVLAALGPLADQETLQQVVTQLGGAAAPPPAADRRRQLSTALAALERRQRRWDEAYEGGDLDRAGWTARAAPLRARQQELRAELAGLPETPVHAADREALVRALSNLSGLWTHLPAPERRQLLHVLLQEVRLGPGGTVAITPRWC